MNFKDDLADKYHKFIRGISLRTVERYEWNIDEQGNIQYIGNQHPELTIAQQLINERTSNSQEIQLWDSFFKWVQARRVVFVK